MKNVWELWAQALPSEACDEIVARAHAYPEQGATIGFDATIRADAGYRTSIVRWLDVAAEHAIVDRLMHFVTASNRTNFGVDLVAPFDLQFTEYHGSAHGKYDWHQDVWLESTRCYDRKLSLVLQLSEPEAYEGGVFEFFGLESPGTKFLTRGSLLIFPSWLQHRVTPVTRGLRRSLVSWVEGPRWR